jgi:hypothetical protein
MKKKIYITAIIMLVLICLSFNGVSAWTDYVSLSTNETHDETTPPYATLVKVQSSYNSTTSARGVYCYLMFIGPGDINYYQASRTLDPGESYYSGWYNSGGILEGAWQLQLNPVGWLTSGCTASATIETN